MDTASYMAWGASGAFVYAAPKLVVALSEARAQGRPAFLAILEFLIALPVGLIAAAGLGPFVADTLQRTALNECTALAVVIGMVANPLSPLLVKVLSNKFLRRIGETNGGLER